VRREECVRADLGYGPPLLGPALGPTNFGATP